MNNWRQVLGANLTNTRETVSKKYREMLLRAHPNKKGDLETFQKVRRAWKEAQQYYEGHNAAGPSRQHNAGPSRPQAATVFIVAKNYIEPASFLRIQGDLTIRDLFQLVMQNAARIKTNTSYEIDGGRNRRPRKPLDIDKGFRVRVGVMGVPSTREKTFIEPQDIKISDIFQKISPNMLEVYVDIREKGQAIGGWFYPQRGGVKPTKKRKLTNTEKFYRFFNP